MHNRPHVTCEDLRTDPLRELKKAQPSPRRARWWLIAGAAFLLVTALGVVIGVAIVMRVETGQWSMPDTEDLVRVVTGRERGPSRTIVLERRAIELRPGVDDAPAGVSSVLASARNQPTRLPGWKGSEAGWKRLVTCVRALFAPFAVTVTDQAPATDDYILVAVGGRPADIGVKNRRVGGLAPFNGDVIPKAVVFAFSAGLGNDVRATCETIGMEVAHAYGLDHEYDCKDVMTYLPSCGARKFVDKDVPCGEKKKRACEGGAATQNSYRRLLGVLGPAPAAAIKTDR
jgi:hypothetical protein